MVNSFFYIGDRRLGYRGNAFVYNKITASRSKNCHDDKSNINN